MKKQKKFLSILLVMNLSNFSYFVLLINFSAYLPLKNIKKYQENYEEFSQAKNPQLLLAIQQTDEILKMKKNGKI